MKFKSDVNKLNSEITDLETEYHNLKRPFVEKVLIFVDDKGLLLFSCLLWVLSIVLIVLHSIVLPRIKNK